MDQTLLSRTDRQTAENGGDPADAPVRRAPEVVADDAYRTLAIAPPMKPLKLEIVPPVQYDGEQYSELILDFDSLTGKDFQRAEREFWHRYRPEKNEMPMPETKHLFHSILAAHLADVPLGLIEKLPRRLYVPLRTECLKACGSSADEEKE